MRQISHHGSFTTSLGQFSRSLLRRLRHALGDRLWRLLGLAGYALHSDDPLDHEMRADLFDIIESQPGAYLSELATATDAPLSTVRYHLKVLEQQAVVTPVKIRGKRRYFPGNEPADELAAALTEDGPADVLRALAREGPSSVSALADAVDRDPSTVTHHLTRLEESGLVERERAGQAVENRLAPAVEATLVTRTDAGQSGTAGTTSGD